MIAKATTPQEYIAQLPEERKPYFEQLRTSILKNIPGGFEETISYGMIGYVVPHSLYPSGYHCDPKLPLPFASIAHQKKFIALYHSGIYADREIEKWFVNAYPKHCNYALDMGKSCIRFKKPEAIPFGLIAQLMQKMTVDDWVQLYEKNIKNK